MVAKRIDMPGVVLRQYLKEDGSFDYELYRDVQNRGNKKKSQAVWVREENIAFLAHYLKRNVKEIQFGLCHGTRRGKEQEWFNKYLGCDVLGTEIADSAAEFPNTIQWDFHQVKTEWLKAADFIYSNSLDHSYDPEACLEAWMSCIKPGGVCILEYTSNHDSKHVTQLDPFGAELEQMLALIRRWGAGKYYAYQVLDGPVIRNGQCDRFIILKNIEAQSGHEPLAIVCPCGPLWKWGYENTAEICLQNQAGAADALYLVHSVKQEQMPDLLACNVVELSSPQTWFHAEGIAPDNEPMVNYAGVNFTNLHERNFHIGREQAWRDGYRVVLYSQSNWYIARHRLEKLRTAADQLVASGERFGLINRRQQFGELVMQPDKAGYLLVNMHGWTEQEVRELVVERKLHGNLVGAHAQLVDCGSEQTVRQLVEHLWRARAERYKPDELLEYLKRRALRSIPGAEVTDAAGYEIALRTKQDSISRLIRKALEQWAKA